MDGGREGGREEQKEEKQTESEVNNWHEHTNGVRAVYHRSNAPDFLSSHATARSSSQRAGKNYLNCASSS